MGSRFGSAITSLGFTSTNNNLESENFFTKFKLHIQLYVLDIAVAAPFEDEGKGVVYIYQGNKGRPKCTQRITSANTNGFGLSLSKPVDIDKNNFEGGIF